MTDELPALEPLLVLDARTTYTANLAGVPGGDRIVADVEGGTFAGPRLRGRIVRSGGDWLTRVEGRSRMDVRLALETDDGVALLLQYTGRASQREGQWHLEVIGSFHAPSGPYDWLNDVQTFGLGALTADGVQYRLYRFK